MSNIMHVHGQHGKKKQAAVCRRGDSRGEEPWRWWWMAVVHARSPPRWERRWPGSGAMRGSRIKGKSTLLNTNFLENCFKTHKCPTPLLGPHAMTW